MEVTVLQADGEYTVEELDDEKFFDQVNEVLGKMGFEEFAVGPPRPIEEMYPSVDELFSDLQVRNPVNRNWRRLTDDEQEEFIEQMEW